MPTTSERRNRHIEREVIGRGIRDPLVVAAMRKVRRELFVPAHLAAFAYDDRPLPIGSGQTISQPYVVALMIEAMQLAGGERVLEIGTGSGYAAAVLAAIAAEVFTIERIGELADLARANLTAAGCTNVHVRTGDGTLGWPEQAPFEAILVSAGAPEPPPALVAQLKIGGRLIVPAGPDPEGQQLMRLTRTSETAVASEALATVRFVPLIGRQGW